MNKPINLLVGGLTLFVAQGCKAPKQASQQAEHPNIIYVFPDQYRNQAMGFWSQDGFRDKVNFEGDPVHTPNLDAFARESMVLSSAQSNCPLSSPHRGMLLTGMYPNKSGVPLNCNSTRPISSLREDAECIGDVFSKAGYDCAYFGKLHADFPTPNDPEHPGQYVEENVRHGMPIHRKNAGTALTTGILTEHLTNTRTRIIGIRMVRDTIRRNGHLCTNQAKSFLI